MKKIVHIFAFFLMAMVSAMGVQAQTVLPDNDQSTVHSDMSADHEDSDTSARDTIALVADSLALDSLLPDDSLSASSPWPQNLCRRLDALDDHSMFETSQLGLMVYDLTADSALYTRGHRQLLRPASTMKLVTAIAAIDKLGGSYQFRTSLYYTGRVDSGTLTGDIYCVGGFDPLFNSDDMKAFVDRIKSMGVDTIRGRILADRTMKSADLLGEGWCWDDDNPVLSPLLVSRHDDFLSRFEQELSEVGIVLDVTTGESSVPNGAYIVCSRFHTIDQVLMRMMKDSDNLYAESLFYQLAASGGNRPAEARHARQAISRLIRKVGLDPTRYKIADGSGLSLYNYLTAELEVALLRYAYRNADIYIHLYPSLPIAGVDGTLKRRMRGGFASGNVHAKTGTLTCITSLAGYCTAANGHVLAFSIINQGVIHDSNGRSFQNRVCEAMCRP